MTTYNAAGRYRTMNSATQRKLNRIPVARSQKKSLNFKIQFPYFCRENLRYE